MDLESILKQLDPAPPKNIRAKKRFRLALIPVILLLMLLLTLTTLLRGREIYNLLIFRVPTVHSPHDQDGDFIDDYTDLMLAARSYIRTQPEYVSSYFSGGYPPEGQGVCTDVLWRALKTSGYDLKAMVDQDIARNSRLYPLPNGTPDANIDFRRVVNLEVFFKRHTLSLTTDPTDIAAWQPGDIVFYEGHVAVVSDMRNAQGQPWIIHHTGHGAFEEDSLTYRPITGHYRWLLQ